MNKLPPRSAPCAACGVTPCNLDVHRWHDRCAAIYGRIMRRCPVRLNGEKLGFIAVLLSIQERDPLTRGEPGPGRWHRYARQVVRECGHLEMSLPLTRDEEARRFLSLALGEPADA